MSAGNLPRPYVTGNNEDYPFSFTFVDADGAAVDCDTWTADFFALRSCDVTSGAGEIVYTGITRVDNVFSGTIPLATMSALTPGSYNCEFRLDREGLTQIAVRGQVDVLGGMA